MIVIKPKNPSFMYKDILTNVVIIDRLELSYNGFNWSKSSNYKLIKNSNLLNNFKQQFYLDVLKGI